MTDEQQFISRVLEEGGPAFPSVVKGPDGGDIPFHGMTLRDYFAAHAPGVPSWFSHPKDMMEYECEEDWSMDRLVQWRWRYADAMLMAWG